MRYPAIITTDGKNTLADFPDCPGCQTFAEPGESIEAQAEEALVGWLESMFEARDTVRPPSRKLSADQQVLWVEVPAPLATALQLRWQREKAGLTQAELARRTGVSQQQIAKLEGAAANPTVGTIAKVARALGLSVDVRLVQRS